MSERWLPIPGYEGLYEASDMGRVRSLDRTVFDKIGRPHPRKGRVLVPSGKGPARYLGIVLSKNAIHSQRYIHHLVRPAIGVRPVVSRGVGMRCRQGTSRSSLRGRRTPMRRTPSMRWSCCSGPIRMCISVGRSRATSFYGARSRQVSNKSNLESHLDAIQMADATGDPEVNSPLVLMLASIGTSLAVIADVLEER